MYALARLYELPYCYDNAMYNLLIIVETRYDNILLNVRYQR